VAGRGRGARLSEATTGVDQRKIPIVNSVRGVHDTDAWMRVHEARTEASRRLDRVAELINAELATP
jgi:hypothetical protein